MELKKKSIPFIIECNACLIKDKLVSQNPMEIILLPQKSWIRPKQILTLKEIRTELQSNRNEQWRRPFSDPYQLPRFCMSGRFQRLLEFFWPTRPHNSTFLHNNFSSPFKSTLYCLSLEPRSCFGLYSKLQLLSK